MTTESMRLPPAGRGRKPSYPWDKIVSDLQEWDEKFPGVWTCLLEDVPVSLANVIRGGRLRAFHDVIERVEVAVRGSRVEDDGKRYGNLWFRINHEKEV